ncbi:hypothetical protein EYC80_003089 [Monilinia laxa]|uniref:Uncharacterized protein n=1 Tax=Monilinia laxa TaxID=61186 RepID=A0A5N6KCR0_MONLA|nr:hypothetical protein EYC80_003089 [Monilinia laxa]
MPPIPPAGGPFSSGASTMATSVVPNNEATPLASTKPVRTTLNGSTIPAAIMSTYSPVALLNPLLKSAPNSSMSLPTTTDPSVPAFSTILLVKVSGLKADESLASSSLRRAVPPPGRIPSSTAARVALRASTNRSFFSPTSTSDAPPTLITATPPRKLGKALLKLLLLVIGCGWVIHDTSDLLASLSNGILATLSVQNDSILLSDGDRSSSTKHICCSLLELEIKLVGEDGGIGQDTEITEDRLSVVAKARSLDSSNLELATELVKNAYSKSFSINIFSNDD